MFELLKTEGKARRGRFHTVHGVIETPVFMNVGTSAAVKGGISTMDLKDVNCQVELSNTYHLHIRPGDELIRRMGGLHKFFNWDRPILTDSGGFQVFSLAKLRRIKEEGVYFQSHMDGKRIFMGPEESMRIQSNIASTIELLKKKGLWIYAADAGGQNYFETDFTGACAIVFGSEGDGVSKLVKDRSDYIVSIPMYGKINSFNVSTAAAVILAEISRQHRS